MLTHNQSPPYYHLKSGGSGCQATTKHLARLSQRLETVGENQNCEFCGSTATKVTSGEELMYEDVKLT